MSKKKINAGAIRAIENELRGASLFFQRDEQKHAPQPPKTALESVAPAEAVSQAGTSRNRAKEGISQLTGLSINQSVGQLVDQLPRAQVKEEKESKQANNIAINIVCNIAILQKEFNALSSVAYKAQTFRFTPEELKQLRDVSYSLSSLLEKKVGQADLLRLGFLLVRKLLETDREDAVAILQAIKK